jgi:Domain of unknown function (DUF4105)
MKAIVRILLIVFIAYNVEAQKLSEQATISVITCGPFQEELYSAFGHSAFRVYDPVQKIDDAYNYGVFDFDQPNFYLNFARGYLYYKLGINDYQRFQNYYIYYNRKVHEQVLNLTDQQKQKLYNYLQWNSLPENVYYRYDYFYNNCATKIRDVVIAALGEEVSFDGSYVTTDYTIRELTDIYLKHQPWGDLGIDIGLGLPIDKKAAPSEYMFLPDYVESGFDHASIQQNGTVVPLVKEKVIIYDAREEEIPGGPPHPLLVFGLVALACVVISVLDYKKKKLSLWLDVVLFGITGLVGCMLFFLWFFTDHNDAAYNLNLLWAMPTNLIALLALKRKPVWLEKYFLVIAILQGLLLVTWWVLPQQLNTALIPVVASLLVRSLLHYRLRKPVVLQ